MKKELRDLSDELNKLANYYEQGGGFGDPDAEKEHDEKINLLKHKQALLISQQSNQIAKASLLIAILSLLVAILSLWFA